MSFIIQAPAALHDGGTGKCREPAQRTPALLVTAEYLSAGKIAEPRVLSLLKKYDAALLPCIRAEKLDASLDRLLAACEKTGVKVVFWPLLPREQGLYCNLGSADAYLRHLDAVYAWAERYGHQVYALVVDIEPPHPPDGGRRDIVAYLKGLDRRRFKESIPVFNAINDKIRKHGTISVSTAMDISALDLFSDRTAWQDLQGGPTLAVDWDFVSFMHFNSMNYNNLHRFGLKWEDLRALTFLLGEIVAYHYGERAGMAVGQTLSGEGKAPVYGSPKELAKDVAALKAAGIKHFCIYDMEGILKSKDPEGWFKAVLETKAEKPPITWKARVFFSALKATSRLLELFRL